MITDITQRWLGGRESYRLRGEAFRTSEYEVAPIASSDEARDFVSTHHYAGRASSTAHRFGLYHHAELVGVALFGPPASENAHRAVWGDVLTQKQAVTLGRLVLLDEVPKHGESWFVARCFKLLASPKLYRPTDKHGVPRPPVVAVESCADPEPRFDVHGNPTFRGHLGTVYCALNGRYVGKTNDATLRLLPDGTCLSNRTQGKLVRGERGEAGAVEQLVQWGADPLRSGDDPEAWLALWRERLTRKMRHRGNHRYLWCLDRRRRRELLGRHEELPYPKNEDWLRARAA